MFHKYARQIFHSELIMEGIFNFHKNHILKKKYVQTEFHAIYDRALICLIHFYKRADDVTAHVAKYILS